MLNNTTSTIIEYVKYSDTDYKLSFA